MPIIQIPVLFDVSGTMQIYGEDTQGQDFIESHMQFTLDMTTDPNYPLNYQDFTNYYKLIFLYNYCFSHCKSFQHFYKHSRACYGRTTAICFEFYI